MDVSRMLRRPLSSPAIRRWWLVAATLSAFVIAAIAIPKPFNVNSIPRNQALFELGEESNNQRAYDPATGHASNLVFSGLVSFNPQLDLKPELAESWDVSPDRTVYTFHLRKNARFHNARPVTAQDFVY